MRACYLSACQQVGRSLYNPSELRPALEVCELLGGTFASVGALLRRDGRPFLPPVDKFPVGERVSWSGNPGETYYIRRRWARSDTWSGWAEVARLEDRTGGVKVHADDLARIPDSATSRS